MGYYTRYKLEIHVNEKPTPQKTCKECGQIVQGTGRDPHKEIMETELGKYQTVREVVEDSGSQKWYEHEEDMKAVSAKFPEAIFILRGEGEEAGDIWVKYFKAGKMQVEKLEVQLKPFDESKLT